MDGSEFEKVVNGGEENSVGFMERGRKGRSWRDVVVRRRETGFFTEAGAFKN